MAFRLSTLTWPFPFLVRLGWATARVPNPSFEKARGRVYLLRGNGIFFSSGMGVLCRRLRKDGWWAEDLRCVGDRWVCRQLLADQRAGCLRGPIIFVGHSCGGRYSLYAAQVLQRAGIQIDLLICLDVALAPEVPANVKRAVHIYLPGPRLYPARALRTGTNSETVIENIEIGSPALPTVKKGMGHLAITNNPEVSKYILKCIAELPSGLS